MKEAKDKIADEADLPQICPETDVRWHLYLPDRTPQNEIWLPCKRAEETFGTIGVDWHRVPCVKRDDVDTKLKNALFTFAQDHRHEAKRYVVVIVSGDSDFSQDL
eukprot:2869631-Amphidinium_carterae.1